MSSSYSISIKFSGTERVLDAAEVARERIRDAAVKVAQGEEWTDDMGILTDSGLSDSDEPFIEEVFALADRKGIDAWDVDAEVQGALLSLAECLKILVPELKMSGEMSQDNLTIGECDRCLLMGIEGDPALVVDEVL